MDLESKMKGKTIETCFFLSHHHTIHVVYDFMMMGWKKTQSQIYLPLIDFIT